MNPEEEERRRVAAEIARRMVDESAGADDAERFDAGTYADDRALAALARPTPDVRAPGRPGEAAQAMSDARGPQEERRGATASQGVIIGGPARGTAPWPAEQRERVQGVEERLQAGDRAGVERDTRLEQAGTDDAIEDRALSQMARPAVTTPTQDPMEMQARASGSDTGMALPEPREALRRPQSFQLREQSMADATDMEPWWASGDEPPRPEARLAGEAERDLEAMEPPGAEPDGDVDDVALAGLAGVPARPARQASPALLDPGFAPTKAVAAHEPGEMIPGAADIDRARMEDGFRRPGRALAALFAGIAGRQLRPRESQEDQMRGRQRQMTADKQRMRGQDEASARAASQDAQRAQAAEASQALATRTADRQDEALELQRQAAARADATAQAQAGVLGERAATARSERERTEARSTPGTDEARRAQTQLQALVNTLPPGASRDRFVEALVGPGMSIDQLSADEVQEVMRRAPEWLRAGLPRASRGRGGAGGPRAPQDRSQLLAAADAAGIPRAVADATPDRQLASMIEQRGRRPGATEEEGVELLPGVHGRASLVERGEGRATRDAFAHAMGNAGSLNRINQIAQEFGGVEAAISREAEAALTPELTMLRSMVAQMGGTGVINPTEVPAINAALPNPSELQQMTFGTFNRRLGAWRAIVEGNVRSRLSSRGVQGEDLDRAMRALWAGEFEMPAEGGRAAATGGGSAPRTPPPAPSGEDVQIELPGGRIGWVPESQLQAATERGARATGQRRPGRTRAE